MVARQERFKRRFELVLWLVAGICVASAFNGLIRGF